MTSRRIFLKNSALGLFATAAVPLWLPKALAAGTPATNRKQVLVIIFQRGAVDGLNVVVPYTERAYYESRPTLAIPRPGTGAGSAVDLDGRFGLNPALAPLKNLWDANQLAIIEAVGSPDPTRSHFDAQDNMESGMPGTRVSVDGWLNRSLARTEKASPLRAVSFTPDLPLALRGPSPAVAVDNLADFKVKDPRFSAYLQGTFDNDHVLGGTSREAFEAMRLLNSLQPASTTTAYPKNKLGQHLQQIAQLIKADVGLEIAFTDVGGWDTHVNQGNQLTGSLSSFGLALAAFCRDLGDRMEDVTVITMSEFGRTVKENGTRGTDHGHGNVMFALGGRVRGGRVYGDWPSLDADRLYEGRDLSVTTDFRTVLLEALNPANATAVFPNFRSPTPPLQFLR